MPSQRTHSTGNRGARSGAGTLQIGGNRVDPAYVASLNQWVGEAGGEFTPEEQRRATQALAFVADQLKPPSALAPRITGSTTLWTLLPAGALLILAFMFGRAGSATEVSGVAPIYLLLVPGILLFLVSFATLAVGLPKWTRVVAMIAGSVSWLWLNVLGGAFLGNNGTNGFSVFLIFAALLVLFIIAIRKAARR